MPDKNGKDSKKKLLSHWKRPAGPLNVWRIIEGEEKLADGKTKPIRFSIQDIPEDRYNEAVEHMCKYFVPDEVMCKSLKLREDENAVNDFRLLWKYLINLGVSVAAYKLGDNDTLLELVGMNALYVETEELQKDLGNFTISFKSPKARRIFEVMHDVSSHVDVCEIYNVDHYISALGLSVAPAYRGQKLGVRLLEARNDIGQKYSIKATSTIFTAHASQIQAERAGFKTVYTQEYTTLLDQDGSLLFPNIESKSVKIMTKDLP